MTASNINYMHGLAQGNNQTNVMSNDLLPCTVVYDEKRAYYDVGVHLRGSQRGPGMGAAVRGRGKRRGR